jgi:hypothetical protein
MNCNNTFKGFILLMLVSILGCANNIDIKQYNDIAIKECIIPINKNLYMKDKNSKLKEYLFVSKKEYTFRDNRLDKQVNIIVSQNKYDTMKFKNSLQKVHSSSLGYLKSIDVKNNLKIWYFQEKINNVKLNLFSYIFLKDTVIILLNHNKKEVEYIVNYCNTHSN